MSPVQTYRNDDDDDDDEDDEDDDDDDDDDDDEEEEEEEEIRIGAGAGAGAGAGTRRGGGAGINLLVAVVCLIPVVEVLPDVLGLDSLGKLQLGQEAFAELIGRADQLRDRLLQLEPLLDLGQQRFPGAAGGAVLVVEVLPQCLLLSAQLRTDLIVFADVRLVPRLERGRRR
eukprot:664447-Hanusia_phi.AAC.3